MKKMFGRRSKTPAVDTASPASPQSPVASTPATPGVVPYQATTSPTATTDQGIVRLRPTYASPPPNLAQQNPQAAYPTPLPTSSYHSSNSAPQTSLSPGVASTANLYSGFGAMNQGNGGQPAETGAN